MNAVEEDIVGQMKWMLVKEMSVMKRIELVKKKLKIEENFDNRLVPPYPPLDNFNFTMVNDAQSLGVRQNIDANRSPRPAVEHHI